MTKVLSCHGPVSNDMTMIAQSLFRALEEGVSAVQINSCDLYRAIRGNVVRVEVPPRVSAVTRPEPFMDDASSRATKNNDAAATAPAAKKDKKKVWVANKRFEISKFKFKIPRARTSELQGSFSAVSKPNFASKYSLESSRRDLHNALLCTVL